VKPFDLAQCLYYKKHMLENKFSVKEITKETGCSHRQLQYWEQKGYLTPEKGPRNVRLYGNNDITFINQLLSSKKDGKTLGEAFGVNNQNRSLIGLDTGQVSKTDTLFDRWISLNNELIKCLYETEKLEKNIPGYPYKLYSGENIKKLEENKNKIQVIIDKRKNVSLEIKEYFQKASISGIEHEEEIHVDSVNALILYWIKKKGQYTSKELAKVRQIFTERLHNGEDFQSIAKKL
jgi:DNA-binding transcriptional MerR regulator